MNASDFSGGASGGGVESLLITLLIAGFVAYRMLGERRMTLTRLAIFPLLIVVLSALSLWTSLSQSWLAAGLALLGVVAGVLVGELTARTQTVRLDPQQPGLFWVKGSPLTVLVFLGSFVLRAGLRLLIGQHALHGALGSLSGALLAFSMALIVTRNLGLYRAALRLRGQVAHG